MTHQRNLRRGDPFKALADPTRRNILELLHRRRFCTAGEIAGRFPRLSRPAVSRHLRVLRNARLVTVNGVGREHRYRLRAEPLAQMQRDWFSKFTALWDASLAALKQQVEAETE